LTVFDYRAVASYAGASPGSGQVNLSNYATNKSKTQFDVVSPGGGSYERFYGTDFKYSGGVVTSGTIHTISLIATAPGFNVTFSEMSLSAAALRSAALTADPADNQALWASLFAGDDVYLGCAGADSFNGGNGNDTASGYKGNDALAGAKGTDTLNGGNGSDTLNGGEGRDVLNGGAGPDTFVFDRVGASHADRVQDFLPGNDVIQLKRSIFLGIADEDGSALTKDQFRASAAGTAADAEDRILYNKADGKLYWDRDGTGTTYDRVHFATLDTRPTLTAADFLIV
jgi:Ca2+-binding RTX toxin-like protein